ncbi:MAG: hypothetical protein H6R26_661 [Proteobacteria bacterium]|nr:hypothetical protein [Pseudomonadota bacterium]
MAVRRGGALMRNETTKIGTSSSVFNGPPEPDKAAMLEAFSVLFEPDDIIELRAFRKGKKQTDAGYFDGSHRKALTEIAWKYSKTGAAVYVILNRVDPQLLGRYANRMQSYAQATTTDANIVQRRWLLVDLDPARPKDTSATEAQLQAVRDKANACHEFLRDQGWPEPITAESGNGMHLLYPLDLPNDDTIRGIIRGCLEGLGHRFDDQVVSVDRSVFNAARIIKLYGTVATKGDHTPGTPWRLSRMVSIPERGDVVTLEQLKAIHPAKTEGNKARQQQSGNTTYERVAFDLIDFLDRLAIEYDQDLHDGRERYKLYHCPFDPSHGKGEAAIFRSPDGKLGFKCQHNSCADRKWGDVRALIDGPKDERARRSDASPEQNIDTMIDALPSDTERDTARQVLAALEHIPGDAVLGEGPKKAPLRAERAIGYGLNNEYAADPDTVMLGRELCARWDRRNDRDSVGSYDRADPYYVAKGTPISIDSVFKLARGHGWAGKVAQTENGDIDTNTPPPKPDAAMLFGLVGDVARAAAKDSEVNPVAAALNFLSFLGSQIGRDVYLQVGNTYHHPNLFTLQAGRSGRGRKGDSIALIHRIRRRIDEVFAGTLGQTHTGGLSTREGLALLIHDGFRDGKKEVEPILDKRLWVVESEFANVLHQGKREGNTLSAALRDTWDGVSIKPAIKTSRVWASRPHIGLACAITPSELTGLIASRDLTNGFANRFLIVWAERTGLVPFPRPTPKDVLDELTSRTASVISFAKGKYPAEADTREMQLSQAARECYDAAYRTELNRPEASDLLTSLLERRAPYSLRLAMLFALTDKTLVIEKHHLEAALGWIRYARDSVRFIFAEAAGVADGEERADIARRLLDFLKDKPDGATRTVVINDCFGKRVSASKIDDAIKGLMTATPPRIDIEERARDRGKPGSPTKIYRAISNEVRGTCGISGMSGTTRDSGFAERAESGGLWETITGTSSTLRDIPQHSEIAESHESSHIPHYPQVPHQPIGTSGAASGVIEVTI